jgi:hypothetical protein
MIDPLSPNDYLATRTIQQAICHRRKSAMPCNMMCFFKLKRERYLNVPKISAFLLERVTKKINLAFRLKVRYTQRTHQFVALLIYFGGVAQLVEHLLCKQGVIGSNPFTSTIDFEESLGLRFWAFSI